MRYLFLFLLLNAIPAQASLVNEYEAQVDQLQQDIFGLPIKLHSTYSNRKHQGEVFGRIDQAFDRVKSELSSPESWCDILLLHLNTKACTYNKKNDEQSIVFYSGRKYYRKPNALLNEKLSMNFEVKQETQNLLHVQLSSQKGPMKTSDYLFDIKLARYNDLTITKFSISYVDSFFSRQSIRFYLKTLGRKKIGFTESADASPFEKGVRGIIERNIIRYYIALNAHLNAKELGKDFDYKAQLWIDATEAPEYTKRLHELPKDCYLEIKRLEIINQQILQQKTGEAFVHQSKKMRTACANN